MLVVRHLYEDNKPIGNCFKLVLASQAVIVGERIERVTCKNKNILLHEHIMGGEKYVNAIKSQMKKDLKVYATTHALKTIRDNLKEG